MLARHIQTLAPRCLRKSRALTCVHLSSPSCPPHPEETYIRNWITKGLLLSVSLSPTIAAVLIRSGPFAAFELQKYWIEQQNTSLRWKSILCRGKYPHARLRSDRIRDRLCHSLREHVRIHAVEVLSSTYPPTNSRRQSQQYPGGVVEAYGSQGHLYP